MHPIFIIVGLILNILTLSLIAACVFLAREWYLYKDSFGDDSYATLCIIFAIFFALITVLGKSFFKLFLGKSGLDEPDLERSSEHEMLDRPEGHKIFLEFHGPKDAPPLILIHGWSSDSTQWYYLKKHLSRTFRLILMDLPSCGKSTNKMNKEYSPDKFARDLQDVIKLTGNTKPIIAGHSIGGMTILSYCKLFSDEMNNKIAGLVLIQTTYTNPVKTSIMSGLLTAIYKPVLRPLCHIMIALAPLLQIMNWLKYLNGSMHLSNHLIGFAGTETKGQLELTSYLSSTSPVAPTARGMLGMFEYDATDILPFIKVPTLVIAGNKDILCKVEASQYITSRIEGAQLHILNPCGHMGPLEQNEDIISVIITFGKKIHSLDQQFVLSNL